jgi:hypothetical protein
MGDSTVPTTAVQPEGEKKKFKWRVFAGHILRAAMWFLVIADARGLLDAVPPTIGRICRYKWHAFLGLPVIYFVFRTIIKKESLKALGEVLVFYVRFVVFLPAILIRFVKLLLGFFRVLSKITKLPQRIEIQLCALILGIITVRIITITNQMWLLYCCMVALGLCLLVLWKSILDWTTNPLRTFGRIATTIDKIWTWFKSKITEKNSDKKLKKSHIQLLWSCGKFFLIVEKWLSKWLDKRFLKTRLLTWFLTFYLVALTLTIFGFAIEYDVLRRIVPHSFGGVMETFADSLYYTALTSFTMSFGETAPTLTLAKVLTFINVAVMMFFFVVLILIFTTVTEESARHHLNKMRDDFSNKAEETKRLSEELFNIDGNVLLQSNDSSHLPGTSGDS